ncbi:MAG: Flp pilus assembly complex ATPase component TadA [Alphaproteobacteria bacterium]|nr:Flp pilus assembly complex ATPase component TadA [Alphaproteobacteria bacterium]
MKIIAVAGARDGVGKSTFAVNAALSLLKETRSRVLVMDLDVDSVGDCAAMLGMGQVKTLADFAPYAHQLQSAQLRQYISAHPAGMGILPLAAAPGAEVDPEAVGQLIELAKPLCDYIIVDCGAGINDVSVKAFEQAAAIFVLCTPDLPVLNHTARFLNQLRALSFPKEQVKVILNAYDAQTSGVAVDLVTRKLERKVLVTLVEAPAEARRASLTGKPFVIDQPRARVSRNYDEFIRKLVELGTLDRLAVMARPTGRGGLGAGKVTLTAEAEAEIEEYRKKRGSKAGKTKELDAKSAVKMLIHKRIVEVMDLKTIQVGDDADEELRKRVREAALRIFDEVGGHITDRNARQLIVKEVVDEALGLGPLEDFLNDDAVTEVMVNRRDQIYVERGGKLTPTPATFTDDAQLLAVIERIVAPIGRRIDEKSPMVDARLQDGSRVNAVIPPLSIDGPCITIRKFSRDPLRVEDLVRFGSFTAEIADFLRACVQAHLNILISGGTGSGKTTLLNVMSSFIPEDERIITVEDSAELQLKQPHVLRLETRPPNIEGVGEVSIRDLVKNTLRMRPDRIVVGECRGAEAIDMLQAMNTGHDGSLTTIHSNSPRDCLTRLETLVMFAGLELPSRAIREQIASAIHIIVQQTRLSDGSRKVTKISEVTGMEGAVITLQDIFEFQQTGVTDGKVVGQFVSTGFIPRFVKDLESKGIALPQGIFGAGPTPARGRDPVPRGRR